MAPYRRITTAVGLAMFVDASLYLAVLPLLPRYADRFHLTTFGAGVLIAAYPAAVPVVSIACIHLVPRFGARRITLVSALLMTASTVIFAFAPSAPVLVAARFVQGTASGSIWTASMAWVTDNAPEGRRGRESGIVMGMLSAGSIAGPAIGALAAWVGSAPAFLLVAAVSAAGVVCTLLAPAGRTVAAERNLREACRRVSHQPAFRAALAIALIDPVAFGSIDLLVPLGLGRMGTSTAAIAAALTGGAALGSIAGPLGGRLVDRIGPARVVMVTALLIGFSPLLLATGLPAGVQLGLLVVFSPIFAVAGSALFPLASIGADGAGVAHVVVNGVLGAAWAVGFTVAPLAIGALAQATSDAVAFAVATGLCVPPLVLLATNVPAAAAAPSRA